MSGDKLRSQFFARGYYDLVVKTGFIRDDKIAATGVMENANNSWMSAAQNPHDATLGTRRNAGPLVSASVAALDARDHLVAVHGVA